MQHGIIYSYQLTYQQNLAVHKETAEIRENLEEEIINSTGVAPEIRFEAGWLELKRYLTATSITADSSPQLTVLAALFMISFILIL